MHREGQRDELLLIDSSCIDSALSQAIASVFWGFANCDSASLAIARTFGREASRRRRKSSHGQNVVIVLDQPHLA